MERGSAFSLSLVASAIVLRIALVFRYRFDSDEPQHMHVAWGWAHGLKQYRDVFDNHMPLFHLLSWPLFAATGDDPRLLFAARLAMVPLFIASIVLVWFLARRLFDERTAWAAALLAAVVPPFFLGSLEYRADDLWVVLWLGVLLVAVSDLAPLRKAALGGLLLGGALGVSLKTSFLAIGLLIAAIATPLLTRRRGAVQPPRAWIAQAAVFLATAAIVPGALCAAFAAAGLWKPFVYGVLEHNQLAFEHRWRVLLFIPLYFAVRGIALAMARSEAPAAIVRRRLFIFLAGGAYVTVYASFCPMTNLESYLPVYPLAALLAAPLLLRRERLVPAFAAAMLVAIVVTAAPWRNEAQNEIALVDEVLAITEPGDTVMDLKGETVFRPRPYYFVLEAVTNVKLRLGTLRDDIADALVRSRTYVVAGERLPPAALRFVHRYYVPWGAIHVAGVQLQSLAEQHATDFDIGIPGPYVVLGDRGVARATIDGRWVGRTGVSLAAGRHRLIAYERAARPVVIWAGALRGARVPWCALCEADH